jgi:hypothetical protein
MLTYREKFIKEYGVPDRSYSLLELARITKIPRRILQQVYNRGIGAFKNSGSVYGVARSVRLKNSYVKNVDAPAKFKLSKENWAFGRIYSFIMGNPKHDNDLRRNKLEY